ncbi:MAG: DUF1801 domain-containing protein [Eubacteriales bacterium]
MEKDNFVSIDAYIGNFKPEVQEILNKIRSIIHEAAPDAMEKISYQMPTFWLNGNLVHFAAFKKHIGFYPTPSAMFEFNDELSKYKTGKGSAQFPIDEPLPYDLIREMVKFRVREMEVRPSYKSK